ncbi:MAG: NUDIX hydrolase [Clostridia bacterium]|nr:NUDIX hydrolase [Clostridia bacterium]MBR3955583.1 NUDIX hydrolase [Clostridia bacterium]
MSELFEKQLTSELVYKGKILDLYVDKVELPNGHTSTREYIKHVGAACVVPVDENGNVIIEKQFRYPFEAVLTEIPAGKLDSKQEPHLKAALRELKEETGYEAEEMIYLGEYYPTCAYSDETIHMYLAKGLKRGEQHLDDDEFVDVQTVPLATLIGQIMAGEIKDGKTQTALLKAYLYLQG